MDLVDECITDDVMNEEGIGCDNITCTIIILHHDEKSASSIEPIKKQSIQKKKSKVPDDYESDLRDGFSRIHRN